MLLQLLNLMPEEAFNRANILLNENKYDSVAYYLSVAYEKYPNEVENVIYLKYLQDINIGKKLAMEFVKYNKKSVKISIIAISYFIKEKKYAEISKFLDVYPETTLIGKIASFYKLVEEKNYNNALKIGEDVLNLLLTQKFLSIFYKTEIDSLDPINLLTNNLQEDYLDLTCSNFFIEECVRQSQLIQDAKVREKALNLIIYYGFFRLIYNAENFEKSYKYLLNFTKLLINNDCEDYNKVLTIFSAIYFEKESYDEYNKFLEVVDTLENYCSKKLSGKIKLLKAFAFRGLDRNKEAIEILNSMRDSLNEPLKNFYLTTIISYIDYEYAKKLAKEFNIKDSTILNFLDSNTNCELLYNKRDFKNIFKRCSENSPERAYAYFLLSKKDSAIEIINGLIDNLESSNRNYAYYWNRGWFELLLGNIDSSYYYTSEALKMRPNNSFLIMNLGSIYLAKQNVDSAIFYYKKAYETNMKYGNYKKEAFFQTLKNDIELISKIYNIPASILREIKKQVPY
ncbi:MAG: hypothetical protein ABIL49_07880 [candidate division WOR-3 bacterium]